MKLQCGQNVKANFEAFKMNKMEPKPRYLVWKIENEIVTEERRGELGETWEQFMASLPENQFRWAMFDFEFTNADNMHRTVLTFCNWCPDAAPMKQRVLYSSSKEDFKKVLDFYTKEVTLSSKNDMTFAEMQKYVDK